MDNINLSWQLCQRGQKISELFEKIKQVEKSNLNLAREFAGASAYSSSLDEVRDVTRAVFQKATGTEVQTWGSWVPDIALSHSLIRYPVTIYDLTPISVEHLEKERGIRFDQFAELVKCGFLKVNLVYYDYKNEESIESYLKEDGVLSALLNEDSVLDKKGIYINSILREPVFSHLAGKDVNIRKLCEDALPRFEEATTKFAQTYARAQRKPDAWEKAIFRGAPPAPLKIAYNYAYLQCAKPYLDVRNDSVLQAIFEERADEKLDDPYHFATFAERLEVCHKYVTAPLTGANAGTYGMSIFDSDKLVQILDEQRNSFDRWQDPNHVFENTVRKTWFELLKDIACGKLTRFADNVGVGPDKTSRVYFKQPLIRMNDKEFSAFLRFLERNQDLLTQSEQQIEQLDKIFGDKDNVSQTDLIDFLRALNDEYNDQGKMLNKGFQELMENALGVAELLSNFDFLGLSSTAIKMLSRSDDHLHKEADKEAVQSMRDLVVKCDQQPRMILDTQQRWRI